MDSAFAIANRSAANHERPQAVFQGLLACLGVLAAAGPALAIYKIGVSPPRVELQCAPGGTASGEILVVNNGSGPFIVQVRVTSWTYNEQGGVVWTDLDEAQRGCNAWVNIKPQEFRLVPGTNTRVQYAVSVPATAVGGYHAALMFLMIPDTGQPTGGGPEGPPGQSGGVTAAIAFQGQVGVPIYVTAPVEGRMQQKAHLEGIQIVPPSGTDTLRFEILFVNEGNTHLNARGKLTVLDATGKACGPALDIGDRTFIPSARQPLKAVLNGELGLGTYKALATVEYGYPEPTDVLVAETEFTVEKSARAGDFALRAAGQNKTLCLSLDNSGYVPVMFVSAMEVYSGEGQRLAAFEPASSAIQPRRTLKIEKPLALDAPFDRAFVVARSAWGTLAETPSPESLLQVVACRLEDGNPGRATVEVKNLAPTAAKVSGVWRATKADGSEGWVPNAPGLVNIEPFTLAANATARLNIEPLPEPMAARVLLLSLLSERAPEG